MQLSTLSPFLYDDTNAYYEVVPSTSQEPLPLAPAAPGLFGDVSSEAYQLTACPDSTACSEGELYENVPAVTSAVSASNVAAEEELQYETVASAMMDTYV